MLGFFGAISDSDDQRDRLSSDFVTACPTTIVQRGSSYSAGVHALAGRGGAITAHGDALVLVSGEHGAQAAARSAAGATARRCDPASICDAVTGAAAASIGILQPKARTCILAADWSGSFPLYYCQTPHGLLFSTLLRPLASAVGASPDFAAISQFLRNGYIVGGRTHFVGVRRLMAGQMLRYTGSDGRLDVHETSRAWADTTMLSPDAVADALGALWDELGAALPSPNAAARCALMMSAGWDSRTLLAALARFRGQHGTLTYSHGDLQSRELELARHIAEAVGFPMHQEPLTAGMFSADVLESAFARTETIVFPHWHHAGRTLRDMNVDVVTSGVFGEILGGHYGPAMLERGSRQGRRVLSGLTGASRPHPISGHSDVAILASRMADRLRPRSQWFADGSSALSITAAATELTEDVEKALTQLVARGISDTDRLIEAFLSEHRGAHYINAQMLSMRSHVDVAMPFCRRSVISLAASIPLSAKLHNAASLRLLRRYSPDLLRFPSAATLVPASAPMIAQEASRLARRTLEAALWRAHASWPNAVRRPRFGWFNLDFMSHGTVLTDIAARLRLQWWDRDRIAQRLARLQAGSESASPQAITDVMLRVFSVDLMCRP